MSETTRTRTLIESVKAHLVLIFGLLGFTWAIELVDLLPFLRLDSHGIHPRELSGLLGIVFAPLLHAGFDHLIVNSLPFVILGSIVLIGGVRTFWIVTAFVTVAGGLGVWFFGGDDTNHIGASGLIFGYLGFILGRGFFEQSLAWALVSVPILLVYGGLLIGVLPLEVGVSWQGHLFGFLAGVIVARRLFPPARAVLR